MFSSITPFLEISNISKPLEHSSPKKRKLDSWCNGRFRKIRRLELDPKEYSVQKNIPNFMPEHERLLGKGALKEVNARVAEKCTLGNADKIGWKEVAVAYFKINSEFSTELRVLKLIANFKPKSGLIKVYHTNVENGIGVSVTKLIAAGKTEDILRETRFSHKIKIAMDLGKALNWLHSQGVNHNDVALRNILIQQSSEKKPLEVISVADRAMKNLYGKDGTPILEIGDTIGAYQKILLSQNEITHVRVLNDGCPDGYLTDFDRCTFSNDSIASMEETSPVDVVAPERLAALKKLKSLRVNKCLEGVIENEDSLKAATGPASDAFSFGQTLCDMFLNPALNTNLTEENGLYIKMCTERRGQRLATYEQICAGENDLESALDIAELIRLKFINPILADVIYGLMKYEPTKRMTIHEALEKLKKVEELGLGFSTESNSSQTNDFTLSLSSAETVQGYV